MSGFYAYTDKALKFLRRNFVREFNRTAMLIRTDEANVIPQTKALYDDLLRETKRVFLRIARNKYKESGGGDTLAEAWLLGFLGASNPLTGYVFLNDTDRKRQYYAEALLSGGNIDEETKKALRYWYGAVRQYADLVTDAAAIQAYTDTGAEFVRWMTAEDEKVCYECSSRNGQIYPVKNVPKKPHYGCRCWIVSAENSLTNSGGSGTIKSEQSFHKEGDDPMYDAFGRAEDSNPKELAAIIKQLQEWGVEIHRGENTVGYGCLRKGQPGVLSMAKNASYSAWLHEFQHVKDDRASGWDGMTVLWDAAKHIQREISAYGVEIALAKQFGRQDLADRLTANMNAEIEAIRKRDEMYADDA